MLRLTIACAAAISSAAWLASEPDQANAHQRQRQCALAIPPAQLAKVPRIELVYGTAPIGWLHVAGPVSCE